MKQKEIWKDIDGFDGNYSVSNLGRVKSNVFRNNRTVIKRERILKPYDNGHGYLMVNLSKGGGRVVRYIHRLVAEAFCPNPNNYNTVNHIDFDRKNNTVENLEWCTQAQNIKHSTINMIGKRHIFQNPSGYPYICIRKDGFEVTVSKKYVGRFKTIEEAINARDEVLRNENNTRI